MPPADALFGTPPSLPHDSASRSRAGEGARDAFLAAIACVVVEPPAYHDFAGAIESDRARAIWTWIARDIAPAEAAQLDAAIASGADPLTAFEDALPALLDRLKANAELEKGDPEHERRNTIQMGGEEARKRLVPVIMALRRRPLLVQAEKFGQAVGTLDDEAALAVALQSITIANPLTRALWMQAMVGHMANPGRAMAAAVHLAGGRDETRLTQAGFAPLVEAMLSHAQCQIGPISGHPPVFSDIDLTCKAVERFHRLMRALNYNADIERRSPWGQAMTDLVARLSARLERPLRETTTNVAQAMRRPREGEDRIDADAMLTAFNGLYLLLTVRRCRDSLAVNAVLDQTWADTGQAVEMLVKRALDAYRADPADAVARERLDCGIKMAEIRFNAQYAEILTRARDGADRRLAQS